MLVKKIIRISIHSFFRDYQTSVSMATVLILPSSAATLLSLSLTPHSSLGRAVSRLNDSNNFPLFDTLVLKLSQTILSFLFALPFTLTFLSLSQSSIFSTVAHSAPLALFPPLLLTHLLTSLIFLSTNIILFSTFTISLNLLPTSPIRLIFLFSLVTITYSTVVPNVVVVCNLATVIAAMESRSGVPALLKACVLIRGKKATALSLALCSNLALALVEALFQIRVVKVYNQCGVFHFSLIFEALTVIYIYSVFRVIDIIMSCCFYKSCRFGGVREIEKGERTELEF